MNKKEIQKRVLKNGEPLCLDLFAWDDKTHTFSSSEDGLVLDFSGVACCTIKTESYCTIKTDSGCTITTAWGCTITTESSCTITTGSRCTITTESNCTITTDSDCTITTGSGCTITTKFRSTITTDWRCTITTKDYCTIKTGPYCTITTTWYGTITTDNDCTIITSCFCTTTTGESCAIIRRDIFEIIRPFPAQTIQTCPLNIPGYLVDGMYNGKPHIIADEILSEIIHKRGNVYKVINYGETETTYLVKQDDEYSHGKTIKEAREGLVYKLSDRDTSAYDDYTLDTVLPHADAIKMYMTITGACPSGTEYFVDMLGDKAKSEYTIRQIIDLTVGQYGHDVIKSRFGKNLEGE